MKRILTTLNIARFMASLQQWDKFYVVYNMKRKMVELVFVTRLLFEEKS